MKTWGNPLKSVYYISKTKMMRTITTLFGLMMFVLSSPCHAQNSIGSCDLFEDGPNDAWPRVITSTTSEDPSSGDVQTLELNVTSLPSEGANYRVVKTVANGNWFFGNATPLQLGANTVTVAAVDFDRSVKFQFSSAGVEFDAVQVNGETLTCASDLLGTAMSDCSGVDNGPNSTWPHVVTSTTSDDASSSEAQTMEILVTSLPAEGGSFRVVKTVANGNWNNGTPVALEIGSNSFTVSAVDFVRSVKFQFSSGDIEFAGLTLNGEAIDCESGSCVDIDSDGICDDVDDCVGTPDALGVCNGTCAEDANSNGICDADEDFVNPSSYCGPGTAWDEATQQCVGAESCAGDLDGDGAVATADLLGFLAVFGGICN